MGYIYQKHHLALNIQVGGIDARKRRGLKVDCSKGNKQYNQNVCHIYVGSARESDKSVLAFGLSLVRQQDVLEALSGCTLNRVDSIRTFV